MAAGESPPRATKTTWSLSTDDKTADAKWFGDASKTYTVGGDWGSVTTGTWSSATASGSTYEWPSVTTSTSTRVSGSFKTSTTWTPFTSIFREERDDSNDDLIAEAIYEELLRNRGKGGRRVGART